MTDETKPVAVVLVGAEGMAEIANEPWQRRATDEERNAFITEKCRGEEQVFENSLVDGIGRPYWLIAILDNAPAHVQEKAKQFARCVKVTE